ncbi:MAG: hypothetical protein H6719_13585 [Sandaracinaceae bacterium]|nr:hypothetical protein [Sandaracinaceae bacterium]
MLRRSIPLLVLAALGAAGCECAASHVRSDAGGGDDAGTDAASAPDAGAPDAGPPPDGVPVLVASTLPDDHVVALSLAPDGTWVRAEADVALPGIPRRIELGPDGTDALVTYVTTIDGERGVVALSVERRPLRITATQTLVLPGPGDLAYLGYLGPDTAVVVRYVSDDQHELITLRRDAAGAWSADDPVAFPVAWPRAPLPIGGAPGRGLVPRLNERDRREPMTFYGVDATVSPLTISTTPATIDAIGVLAMHPTLDRGYLFAGTPGVPSDETQTGQLHVLDEGRPDLWLVLGPYFALPNEPELAAVAPDGAFAMMLEPIVDIDHDPATGEPIFTRRGYGLDRVNLNASGVPQSVEVGLGRIEADRVEALGLLADGRVLVARSIGSGPIEGAIVALELVGDRLEPQSQIVVDGLLRATFGRE